MRRAGLAWLGAVAFIVLAACGDGGREEDGVPPTRLRAGEIAAQVASYDVVAGSPRLIVGLVEQGTGKVVSFGTAELRFAWFGEASNTRRSSTLGDPVTATWIPIPGQRQSTEPEPRVVKPSEGVGVYEVPAAPLDRPGLWGISATVRLEGKDVEAKTTVEVAAEAEAVGVGESAPLAAHATAASRDIPPAAVDSRAKTYEDVPDAVLHQEQLADIVASRRPALVVISTPVYCVSQFCGPVTDTVQRIAAEYAGRAGFVHLEVWRDFEAKNVNDDVFPWISPGGGGDIHEPWVFLVGADGKVARRWDNVVAEDAIRTALASHVS